MKKVICPTCNGMGKVEQSNAQADYKKLGTIIRRHREHLNITQEVLAAKVGLLRTSITNIEAGRQKPPLDTLYRIADILSIEIQQLL